MQVVDGHQVSAPRGPAVTKPGNSAEFKTLPQLPDQVPYAGTSSALALAIAMFVTMLPVTMMVPVLKELVADRLRASDFWTHAFMSVNMIGAVLVAPWGGALADRFGRRRPILIIALLFNAALLWLMPKLASLPLLMAVRFLEGGAHILAVTSIMAIASDRANPAARGRMMGLIGSALIFGTACGAPLGGRLGQINPILVFQTGAVLSVFVALWSRITISGQRVHHRGDRHKETLNLIRREPSLLVVYAYAFIDRFCVGVVVSSFVLFLGKVHGLSPAERGGMLALFLFPFALLCYPVGRLSDRYGRAIPMCLGNIGFGVVFAAYGFVSRDALPLMMLASGILSAVLFAPNLAMCTDLAPSHQRATAYAGFNAAGSFGFLLGPLVGGSVHGLAAGWGDALWAYRVTFVMAGSLVIGWSVVSIPWLIRLCRSQRTR